MKKWLFLSCAIALEVAGTLALRASLDDPLWIVLVATGYIGAFVFLAIVLRHDMPIGVAYGVWGASGVAITAILAHFLFGDPFSAMMGAGIAAVALGVVLVEVGSHTRVHPKGKANP